MSKKQIYKREKETTREHTENKKDREKEGDKVKIIEREAKRRKLRRKDGKEEE